jgi:hypothetical protein
LEGTSWLLRVTVFLETIKTNAEAFSAQRRLLGFKKFRKVSQLEESLLEKIKRQGWALLPEGAHRAASKTLNKISSGIASPVKARGDQRSVKMELIG